MSFTFVDLFAGIGGFHATLAAAGGRCVMLSEIDSAARDVYVQNWLAEHPGDVVLDTDVVALTEPRVKRIPQHDVLAAGFPCQAFSKSGHQRGIHETRGTLFYNTLRLAQKHRPSVIMLENVRNLTGPRHRDTWATIIRSLREIGYRVSDEPTILSPHRIPPERGGRPQVRDRVYILGTYVGRSRAMRETDVAPTLPRHPFPDHDPNSWDIRSQLDDLTGPARASYALTDEERRWIEVWDAFVKRLRLARGGEALPGFPLWADAFVARPRLRDDLPAWKVDFLRKNSRFYREHKSVIDEWRADHPDFVDFPASRRKLEWQAKDLRSINDCLVQLRPSGIRVRPPTYVPALVAINQTSIHMPSWRRLTPTEGARLQGLPEWFDFGDQPDARSYKQLGNGISVGAAYLAFRTHVLNDPDVACHVRDAVSRAGDSPVVPRRPHISVSSASA